MAYFLGKIFPTPLFPILKLCKKIFKDSHLIKKISFKKVLLMITATLNFTFFGSSRLVENMFSEKISRDL